MSRDTGTIWDEEYIKNYLSYFPFRGQSSQSSPRERAPMDDISISFDPDDDVLIVMSFKIPIGLRKILFDMAKKQNTTVSEIIRRALITYVNNTRPCKPFVTRRIKIDC